MNSSLSTSSQLTAAMPQQTQSDIHEKHLQTGQSESYYISNKIESYLKNSQITELSNFITSQHIPQEILTSQISYLLENFPNDTEIIKLFLECGADVNAIVHNSNLQIVDSDKITLLMFSIITKNLSLFDVIIKFHPDTLRLDASKRNPVVFSILFNDNNNAMFLLKLISENKDVWNTTVQLDQYGTIHNLVTLATKENKYHFVDVLLQAGGDVNFQTSPEEDTAMHIAVRNDNVELCELIYKHPKFNRDLRNSERKTARDLSREKKGKVFYHIFTKEKFNTQPEMQNNLGGSNMLINQQPTNLSNNNNNLTVNTGNMWMMGNNPNAIVQNSNQYMNMLNQTQGQNLNLTPNQLNLSNASSNVLNNQIPMLSGNNSHPGGNLSNSNYISSLPKDMNPIIPEQSNNQLQGMMQQHPAIQNQIPIASLSKSTQNMNNRNYIPIMHENIIQKQLSETRITNVMSKPPNMPFTQQIPNTTPSHNTTSNNIHPEVSQGQWGNTTGKDKVLSIIQKRKQFLNNNSLNIPLKFTNANYPSKLNISATSQLCISIDESKSEIKNKIADLRKTIEAKIQEMQNCEKVLKEKDDIISEITKKINSKNIEIANQKKWTTIQKGTLDEITFRNDDIALLIKNQKEPLNTQISFLQSKFQSSNYNDDYIIQCWEKDLIDYQQYIHEVISHKSPAIMDLTEKIQQSVNEVNPDYKVNLYGSYSTDWCWPWSDLDFCLVNTKEVNDEYWLSKLYMKLKAKPWVQSHKFIENTNVPIIKWVLNDQFSFHIDISLDRHGGLQCVSLVRSYLKEYVVLEPIILALKTLLNNGNWNNPYTGGLSSYGWVWMVVSFIQSEIDNNKYNNNDKNILGTTFLNVLGHYGIFFDYNKYVIITYPLNDNGYNNDSDTTTYAFGTNAHELIIVDPWNKQNNVAKSSFQYMNIKMAFMIAYMVAKEDCECGCHYGLLQNKMYVTEHCILKRIFNSVKRFSDANKTLY